MPFKAHLSLSCGVFFCVFVYIRDASSCWEAEQGSFFLNLLCRTPCARWCPIITLRQVRIATNNRGMNCARRTIGSNRHQSSGTGIKMWLSSPDWDKHTVLGRGGKAQSTWGLCWINPQQECGEDLRPLGTWAIKQLSLARSILREGNELLWVTWDACSICYQEEFSIGLHVTYF